MEAPTASLSDTPVISGVYTPLEPTEIRLVEILPGAFGDPIYLNINVVDLKNDPVYDALSYVWYPRDGTIDMEKSLEPARIIKHDSSMIPPGANSQSGCKEPGRVLWIDALCINQDLTSERNHQVRLMKSIYSSAKHVLIWLGPAQDESGLVVSVMRTGHLDTSQRSGALHHMQPFNLNLFLDSLELLLRRQWF